ncbi:MAG: hypothetical protein OHK0053_23420 [Microscillaceae bacterium]
MGSVVMLFFYKPLIVVICLSLLLPIVVNNYFYAARIRKVQTAYNNELERQVEIIGQENLEKIAAHYHQLKAWKIRISDLGAINFGATEFFILGVIAFSLLTLQGETRFGPGDIFGIYTYVYQFAGGFDFVPDFIERISQIRDIETRIEADLKEYPSKEEK